MSKALVFPILFFLFATLSLSQAKEVTKGEFYQIYYSALDKTSEVDRRLVSKLEYHRNGTISESEEWVYEYSGPAKRRFVYKKSANGSTSSTEEINIDEHNYCKVESRSWEKIPTNCIKGFPATTSQASHQVLGIISSQFTVSDVDFEGAKAKLFVERTTYKNQSPRSTDGGRLRFYEKRFWLGLNGLILRQETKSGIIGDKNVSSLWLDVYTYNPKDLRIEAPIE